MLFLVISSSADQRTACNNNHFRQYAKELDEVIMISEKEIENLEDELEEVDEETQDNELDIEELQGPPRVRTRRKSSACMKNVRFTFHKKKIRQHYVRRTTYVVRS